MRIRAIKPGFYASEEIANLPPLTRILFTGLWGLADRRGRLEDRPRRIKVEILPYDDYDVDAALTALQAAGFVIRYESDGAKVIQVVNFEKHQRINGKEAATESVFPEYTDKKKTKPPGKQKGSSSEAAREAAVKQPESQEGKGREGKGNDTPIPPGGGVDLSGGGSADTPEGILTFLNEVAARDFRPTPENLTLIRCRLEEVKGDASGIRAMLSRQAAKWKTDPKMCDFLRPATLFGKQKFGAYYDDRQLPLLDPKENGQTKHQPRDKQPHRNYFITGPDTPYTGEGALIPGFDDVHQPPKASGADGK